MKKIIYLPALIAAITTVSLCSSCGGVHPPARKDTSQDTTQKTSAKPDTAAAKGPSAKTDTTIKK